MRLSDVHDCSSSITSRESVVSPCTIIVYILSWRLEISWTRLDSCLFNTFACDLGLSRFISLMAGIISPLSEAQDGPFVSSSVLNLGVLAIWSSVVSMQAFLLNNCFASKSSSHFRFYSLGESLARSNWSWSDKSAISFLLWSLFIVFRKTSFFV